MSVFIWNHSRNSNLLNCNNYLTLKLLRVWKIAVPLHTVISFSVINYVVSMRCPTRVAQLIFFTTKARQIVGLLLYGEVLYSIPPGFGLGLV